VDDGETYGMGNSGLRHLDENDFDLELFKYPRVYALTDMFRIKDLKELSYKKSKALWKSTRKVIHLQTAFVRYTRLLLRWIFLQGIL